MIAPPALTSLQEHIARRGDVDFWRPYLTEILERHGLTRAGQELQAGYNVTYPTFLSGDVVVKLFGYSRAWQARFADERTAYTLLATDPTIAAPRLLAAGHLYPDAADSWPYLVTTRMAGIASWRADLSTEQWRSLAADLGEQVRRIHALPPAGVPTHADWVSVDVTTAAHRSSLPPHLAAQAAEYVARLGTTDPVVVHGDLTQNHAYVDDDGRLVGLIDWGDMLVADRHFEIIQVYRDMFRCEKELLRIFLEAAAWPPVDDFPRQALGMALHRQAVGLAQHHTIDVFMPIAEKFPLADIPTLDDLAAILFGP
jgi:aminoglycoside phosphotransferase (APT) family kinase protein